MNELKILKKENLNIKGINKELAVSKGLIKGEDYTNYLYIQALYRKAFEAYIMLKAKLDIFDNKLSQSELDFGPISEEKKSDFHKNSYLNLKYLYIRNYFYVEKLNEEQIKVFYNRLNSHNYEVDNQLLQIIEDTYKDVINDNFKHGKYKDNTTAVYGSVIPSNIVDSKSLVIILHYGRNTKEYTDEEFLINQLEKKVFLEKLSTEMEEEITKLLNIETRVIINIF